MQQDKWKKFKGFPWNGSKQGTHVEEGKRAGHWWLYERAGKVG